MGSTTIVGDSDRTLFIGPRVPNYLKTLHKSLSGIKLQIFRQLLKLAMQDFEGKKIDPKMYQLVKKSSEDNQNIDIVYGALHVLIKSALSSTNVKLKPEVFKEDLRELKIQDEFIDDLTNVVFGPKQASMINHFINNAPHLPKLRKFRWRVDVAISTSYLNRVLEPTIIVEIELSDGRLEIFEVHPSQFHRLRFAVSTLLKEMKNLEMRNVLKM